MASSPGAGAGAGASSAGAQTTVATAGMQTTLAGTPLDGLQGEFSSAMGGMILHLHVQDTAMQARIQQLERGMQELQRGPPVDAIVQTVLSGEDIQAGIEARAAIAEIATRPADSGDSAALSLASRANEAVDALRQHLCALEAQVSQLDTELKAHRPVVVDSGKKPDHMSKAIAASMGKRAVRRNMDNLATMEPSTDGEAPFGRRTRRSTECQQSADGRWAHGIAQQHASYPCRHAHLVCTPCLLFFVHDHRSRVAQGKERQGVARVPSASRARLGSAVAAVYGRGGGRGPNVIRCHRCGTVGRPDFVGRVGAAGVGSRARHVGRYGLADGDDDDGGGWGDGVGVGQRWRFGG